MPHTATPASPYAFGALLASGWQDGHGGSFETRNPSHPGHVVGRYTAAGADQVAEAVHAARKAQRAWAKSPPLERGAVLARWLDALGSRRDDVVHAIVLEQGKPLAEARGEFDKGLAEARMMVGLAARGHGEVMPAARPGFRNLVLRRPRGVIVAV